MCRWMCPSISLQTGSYNYNASKGSNAGYSRSMYAYADVNGNGECDTGNVINGAPTTYQEAYRKFRSGLTVPPDPKIEVDEQELIDIGQGAHGLGVGFDFWPFNPIPDVQQWFKTITIKNDGNVNLPNVRVGKSIYTLVNGTMQDVDVSLTRVNDASYFVAFRFCAVYLRS